MPTAPGSPRKGSSFGCLSPPPQPRARSKMSSGEMSPRKRNPSGGGTGGPVGKGSGSGAPAATGAKTSQRPGAAGENQTSRRPAAGVYRMVQLDFTPGIEVFFAFFYRCHCTNGQISIKHHTQYSGWKWPCEGYCFWLQKLRFLVRLCTDLAKNFGDL